MAVDAVVAVGRGVIVAARVGAGYGLMVGRAVRIKTGVGSEAAVGDGLPGELQPVNKQINTSMEQYFILTFMVLPVRGARDSAIIRGSGNLLKSAAICCLGYVG